MEFVKPEKFTARVSEKYAVGENQRFLYVKFELVLPDRISFQAGQYVSMVVNEEGERRSYSIASTPDNDHGFHILAEVVDGGKGSEFLRKLRLGDVVEILAPLGRFVVRNPPKGEVDKLLFVATGSGIVPIYSMINDLLINKHESRQMRLHWGMRNVSDLFWVDNFGRLMEDYPNFVFDLVLSKPIEGWELCSGHVQDCLMRDFPPSTGSGLEGWEAYVCGKTELVIDVAKKLEELKMKKENIFHEKYT